MSIQKLADGNKKTLWIPISVIPLIKINMDPSDLPTDLITAN